MLGLFIRGIEENSRSRRDGLFHENECIVKINHVDLVDRTFAQWVLLYCFISSVNF